MSNDLSIFKNLPTLRDTTDALTDNLAGSSGGMRRLVASGKMFREMIGGKIYRENEERSMNIVIVNSAPNNYRMYYKGAYVEGQTSSPVCWSVDGGRTSFSGAPERQSTNCATCPQNIAGSGAGETKACRFHRRLAVVIDGEIVKKQVYQLLVPAKSLFGDGEKGKMPLIKYAEYIRANGGRVGQIVTKIKFDNTASYDKLFFDAVRPLEQEESDIIEELKTAPETLKAIELDIKPSAASEFEMALPAVPVTPKPKVVAKPKAEPVEEDIPEPTVKHSKKPIVESKVEDLVAEWDD